MTVLALTEALSLELLHLADGAREVSGGYAGDLLSWVMGRAEAGDAWVTIMGNQNSIAVATLAEVSCVILAESSEAEASLIALAKDKEVNLLRSDKNTFELCCLIGKLLEGERDAALG